VPPWLSQRERQRLSRMTAAWLLLSLGERERTSAAKSRGRESGAGCSFAAGDTFLTNNPCRHDSLRRAQLSVRCPVFAGSLRAGMGGRVPTIYAVSSLMRRPAWGRGGAPAAAAAGRARAAADGASVPHSHSRNMETFLPTATHRAHTSALNTLTAPANGRASADGQRARGDTRAGVCLRPPAEILLAILDITGKAPVADRLTGEEFGAAWGVRDAAARRRLCHPQRRMPASAGVPQLPAR
jgi:hypothetical protein